MKIDRLFPKQCRRSAPGGAIASTNSGRHRAVPLTPQLGSALCAIEHQGELVVVNENGTRLRPGQGTGV